MAVSPLVKPSRIAELGDLILDLTMKTVRVVLRMLFLFVLPCLSAQLQSADLYKLHGVGGAQFSPDGKHIAYTVGNSDRPGKPWRQVWIMEVSSGKTMHLGGSEDPSGS